jgi:hypothetical protein
VTAPKPKKNTTTPDGSKEPSKPDLGNSSATNKSASAPSSAKTVTAKVDKAFKDAAKLPEHSHDGIKVSNDTKAAQGNSTLPQKEAKAQVANATKVNSTQANAKIAKKV